METNIEIVMGRMDLYLARIDTVLRHGHTIYETYDPAIVLDHDASTQAHCTFRHTLAEAHLFSMISPVCVTWRFVARICG